MDAAWALGLTAFDTADAYGGGRSETAIGKWIRETGNRPTLTTKTFAPMDAGQDHGLGRDRVLRQLDSSLARLGVERVDLYLAPAPVGRLAGGWPTGKYHRDQPPPPGSRMAQRPEPYEVLRTDRVFDGLDAFAAAAAERGTSTATLAHAWLLAQPYVTAVIAGP